MDKNKNGAVSTLWLKMTRQLELGPQVKHMGFVVGWAVCEFHDGSIIASEAVQPFQENSERRERLCLLPGEA